MAEQGRKGVVLPMGALLRLDLASDASRLLAWPGLSSSVEPAVALAASVAASSAFFSSVLAGSTVSGTAKDAIKGIALRGFFWVWWGTFY
jgi:hypothetical protein